LPAQPCILLLVCHGLPPGESRPPPIGHRNEFRLVPGAVGVALFDGDHPEHLDHIRCYCGIDRPEVRQVEAAAILSVPPSQQEIRHSCALAAIAVRYLDEALQGGFLIRGHGITLKWWHTDYDMQS
jgi:hypothetical protein